MAQVQNKVEPQDAQLARYIDAVRASWKDSDPRGTAMKVQEAMERLLKLTPKDEPWVRKLTAERPPQMELYRDPDHGFVQMGHYHPAGHANTPHGHGGHWVVYGVYSGQVDIDTYRWNEQTSKLEVKETHHLTPGVARAYLPGEIHSTRQVAPGGSIILRFLSTDLTKVKRERYDWDQVQT